MSASKALALIALVPAIALACVLVSPDSTDDVDGVAPQDAQIQSKGGRLISVMDPSPIENNNGNLCANFTQTLNSLSGPPDCNYRC